MVNIVTPKDTELDGLNALLDMEVNNTADRDSPYLDDDTGHVNGNGKHLPSRLNPSEIGLETNAIVAAHYFFTPFQATHYPSYPFLSHLVMVFCVDFKAVQKHLSDRYAGASG